MAKFKEYQSLNNMQTRNIFCPNDWDIRSFFVVILSVYLVYGGTVALNILGFSLLFLQQITGFILLLFIPGFLLLRILKLHALGTVETIAYAVGLSLAVLMLSGFFINMSYPLFGVTKPLSFPYMLLTFSVIIAILGIMSYLRDKEYHAPCTLDLQQLTAPVSLAIYSVPCVSIIGSFLIGRYHNNALSIASIILIAVLVLWFAYKKPGDFLSADVLLILSISISLLFGDLLISEYPRRLNVDGEFYYLNQVIQSNYWDPSLPGSANSVLSIVILGTIFSEGLGLNPFFVLKTVYPLIFAIVPTIIYTAYKKEFSSKLSLFAALFFMFNFYFFTEALLLRRQQIALIFVALLLLLLTEKRLNPQVKSVLYLIFTISLVISHYSVSVNWILIVILASSIYFIKKNYDTQVSSNLSQQNKLGKKFILSDQNISPYHIVFLVAIFVVWYVYIGFSVFSNIVGAGNSIIKNFALLTDTSSKSPTISAAMGAGFWEAPPYSKVYRLLQYGSQGFILIGLMSNILSQGFQKLSVCFRAAAMAFLITSMVLPLMSIFQNMPRLYFFALLFLSPCCIIGACQVYHWFCQLCMGLKISISKVNEYRTIGDDIRRARFGLENRSFYTLFAIFILIPFFFFNCGLMFDIGGFNEDTRSIARIPSSNILSYGKIDPEYPNMGEVMLGLKIPQFLEDNPIYADILTGVDLISTWHKKVNYFPCEHQIPENSYIFIRSWNIERSVIRVPDNDIRPTEGSHFISLSNLSLQNKDYLYNNGYAALFRTSPGSVTKVL